MADSGAQHILAGMSYIQERRYESRYLAHRRSRTVLDRPIAPAMAMSYP